MIRNKHITRYQFRDTLLTARAGESDYTRYDRATADMAADYLLREARNKEKPFVLFVSFCTPHFPLIAPQEFVDMYPDPEKLPRPVQFDPGEWPHHPLIDDYRRYCGTDQVDEAAALNGRRIYYALCSFMDAQVGKVMTALRESGLAEETRVLYCADHGDTMGAHGVYYKSTMYEGSVGIPMLLARPDIPVGATVSTNVSLLDVFPTVLDCVGARPSDKDRCLPGRSLIGIAINAPDEDRAVCAEYYSQGIYTAMFMLRCFATESISMYIMSMNDRSCSTCPSIQRQSGFPAPFWSIRMRNGSIARLPRFCNASLPFQSSLKRLQMQRHCWNITSARPRGAAECFTFNAL